MASWLKRAEDLFEVVDRRAKLAVSELADEQSDIPQAASNGKGTQARKSKSKAKAKAQRRAAADEQLKKIDSRQEEGSSQPSVSDVKSDETLTSSLVESSGLTTESSKSHSNNELQDKIDNGALLDAPSWNTSANEAMKQEADQKLEAAVANKKEVISSSSNGELGSENVPPITDVAPSLASGAPGTEAGLENHPVDPCQNIGLRDLDDSVKPREEKSQPTIGDAPGPVTTDEKKAKPLDGTAEPTSNATKQENTKEKASLNKVEEQLDELVSRLKVCSNQPIRLVSQKRQG